MLHSIKLRIIITTMLLCTALGAFYYVNTRQRDPMEVISLIARNINPKDGSIMDYAGDIHFRGPESVGYTVLKEDKIRIYFGDLQFDMDKDDFLNERLMETLKTIGIEIKMSKKTGKFIVKYKGEPVDLFMERK